MSDDDDWGFNEKKIEDVPQPKVQVEESNSRGRGRRGQPSEIKKEQTQNKDEWITNPKEQSHKESASTQKRGRSQNRHQQNIVNNVSVEENISDIIHPGAVQLKPQEEESSWLQKNNNDNKKEETNILPIEEKEENGGRGNRGTRGNRGGHNDAQPNEGGRFNNRNNQENGSQNRRGNRGNRQGQQGRGGYNRDYNRENNRDGDGNRNYRNFNNGGNDREGGYRRNRQQGDNRENNNNWRGDHRGRGRGGFGDRGDRGERGDRGDRGDRGERGGRGDRGNWGDRFNGGDRDAKKFDNQAASTRPDQKTLQSVNQKLVPATIRRAWPSCQIFVFGKKLGFTLRKVQLFKSKLLIVPYRNLKFDYYGGNYVAACKIDYKEKIKLKGAELQKGGSVYFQKAKDLDNYIGVAFLRVDEADVFESLKIGITQIIKKVEVIQMISIMDTIVFPISKQLCEPNVVLNLMAHSLQTSKKVKEVALATNDPIYFQQCISDYSKYVTKLCDENDLYLQ